MPNAHVTTPRYTGIVASWKCSDYHCGSRRATRTADALHPTYPSQQRPLWADFLYSLQKSYWSAGKHGSWHPGCTDGPEGQAWSTQRQNSPAVCCYPSTAQVCIQQAEQGVIINSYCLTWQLSSLQVFISIYFKACAVCACTSLCRKFLVYLFFLLPSLISSQALPFAVSASVFQACY